MLAISLLIGIFTSYSFFGAGVEFFPDIEPNSVMVNVHARGDLSVVEKDKLVREVEQRIIDLPHFKSIYARSGTLSDRQASADTVGMVTLELKDWKRAAQGRRDHRGGARAVPRTCRAR